ncbi:hypothetical protein C0992_011551 [Termitomyces sp. T32_za158]|nr:hypothetical protein C0992_011551 [Termitomyces sp. T32_za158]
MPQRHTSYEITSHGLSARRTVLDVPAAPSEKIHTTEPEPEPDFSALWTNNIGDHATGNEENAEFPFESMIPEEVEDHPLLEWRDQIDLYIQEVLRQESHTGSLHCTGCLGLEAKYRCIDCLDLRLFCARCLLQSHTTLPFHWIQEWTGLYYRRTSLGTIGLTIQVGHVTGEACINSIPVKCVILHTNGIHEVIVKYCDCMPSIPRNIQLLRARLFPATIVYPKTAATFQLLEHFQLLSFMSKVSAFEFYQTLARLTCNTGLLTLPDRYVPFMRMVREWRHIRMLKRVGRGHAATGVKGTSEGECAVLCPACPLPGINLPLNWRSEPPDRQWLYALFVGIDANFRLKRLKNSSDAVDPGLNHGYAYYVEDTKFKAYLNKFGSRVEDDISTCNNHDAIKSAAIRGGKGVDASGVGKAECARHDMKRPISIGDLQKGERYVNMDYFFLSSLSHNAPDKVIISYDIICQWGKNLRKRCLEIYPPNRFPEISPSYLIPKFHLAAHRPECQVNFSFNFSKSVGRTDGEAPERGWAAINAIAASTKEMGPGSRRDTLDDHFGDYNWRKIVTLAAYTFVRKVKDATKKRAEHVLTFEAFDQALALTDTVNWTHDIQAWECDRTKPNPFAAKLPKITENAIRLELAQEEEASLHETFTEHIHDDVSPSRLIAQGLELEDHQRTIRIDARALGLHSTDLQRAKVIERGNRLYRKIEAWCSIQALYIPSVALLRARDEHAGGDEPSSTFTSNLYLPSAIVNKVPCDHKFLDYEYRLRFAQAHATLDEIRYAIILRSQMYKSKDQLIRGQRMNTRSLALIDKATRRIKNAQNKYKEIRSALTILGAVLGKVGWEEELQELTDRDIRGITSLEDDRSEGSRVMSWIWLISGSNIEGEGKQEALRIEWCKSRARAHRFQEECLLLQEEMRRVLAFYENRERHWATIASASPLPHVDDATQAGMRAYAHRQAALQRSLATTCRVAWADLPNLIMTGPGAPVGNQYLIELH